MPEGIKICDFGCGRKSYPKENWWAGQTITVQGTLQKATHALLEKEGPIEVHGIDLEEAEDFKTGDVSFQYFPSQKYLPWSEKYDALYVIHPNPEMLQDNFWKAMFGVGPGVANIRRLIRKRLSSGGFFVLQLGKEFGLKLTSIEPKEVQKWYCYKLTTLLGLEQIKEIDGTPVEEVFNFRSLAYWHSGTFVFRKK